MNANIQKFWIVMGACSDDPDVYPGLDIVPGETVEWQISDGPAGERGFSDDHVDPLGVLDDIRNRDGVASYGFESEEEKANFLKACELRAAGAAIIDLPLHPGYFESDKVEFTQLDWRGLIATLDPDWDAWREDWARINAAAEEAEVAGP